MDITGKVIAVLSEQRFSGKNGEVVKNVFVIEHGGQYKKKAVFSVFGEDRWKQMGVVVGADVQVSFDIDAREWNGRWFGELSAWRVQAIGVQQSGVVSDVKSDVQVQSAGVVNAAAQGSNTSGDLPF